MYKEVAKLILYRDLGENSILRKLAGIFEDYEKDQCSAAELTTRIYEQMKALLDLSTMYGFDENLWHNYLTFILLTNENSFSMTSEKVGANDGTVNHFAKADFKGFKHLLIMISAPSSGIWRSTASAPSATIRPSAKKSGCTIKTSAKRYRR